MAEVGAGELLVRAHDDGRRRRPRWLGPGDFKHSARITSGLYRSYGVKGRFTDGWAHRRMDGEASSPAAARMAWQTAVEAQGGQGARLK
jgi:hypothetical protein